MMTHGVRETSLRHPFLIMAQTPRVCSSPMKTPTGIARAVTYSLTMGGWPLAKNSRAYVKIIRRATIFLLLSGTLGIYGQIGGGPCGGGSDNPTPSCLLYTSD